MESPPMSWITTLRRSVAPHEAFRTFLKTESVTYTPPRHSSGRICQLETVGPPASRTQPSAQKRQLLDHVPETASMPLKVTPFTWTGAVLRPLLVFGF